MPDNWEGSVWRQIKSAVYHRDCEALKEILSSYHRQDKSSLCESILCLSIARGHLDVVKYLVLEQKVNLNFTTENYYEYDSTSVSTPLHLAVKDENAEIVQFLLEHGANPNVAVTHLRRPLSLAVAQRAADIVKMLLEHGASAEYEDCYGYTPLYEAVEYYNNDEIISLLVNNGAIIDEQMIESAVITGNAKFVNLLLAQGANPNHLHCAAQSGSIEMVYLLLSHGADINTSDDRGSALHVAVQHSAFPIVKLLVEFGVDIEIRDSSGSTALHCALKNRISYNEENLEKMLKTVESFIDLGASLDSKINDLWTPLHLAAYERNTQAVELLLNRGADINAETDSGKSVMTIAMQPNKNDVRGRVVDSLFLSTMLRHIVFMRFNNQHVSDNNFSAITDEWQHFVNKCRADLKMIRDEKFKGTEFSCFDILRANNLNRLASITRQDSVREFFENDFLGTKCFVYKDLIRDNYDKGLLHGKTADKINYFFNYLANRNEDKLPKLPSTCLNEILRCFNPSDKRVFLNFH